MIKRAGKAYIRVLEGKPIGISIQMGGRELTRLMRSLANVGPKHSVVFEAELVNEFPPYDSILWVGATRKKKFKVAFELSVGRR